MNVIKAGRKCGFDVSPGAGAYRKVLHTRGLEATQHVHNSTERRAVIYIDEYRISFSNLLERRTEPSLYFRGRLGLHISVVALLMDCVVRRDVGCCDFDCDSAAAVRVAGKGEREQSDY